MFRFALIHPRRCWCWHRSWRWDACERYGCGSGWNNRLRLGRKHKYIEICNTVLLSFGGELDRVQTALDHSEIDRLCRSERIPTSLVDWIKPGSWCWLIVNKDQNGNRWRAIF